MSAAALLAQLNTLPPDVNGYSWAAEQVRIMVSSEGSLAVHYSQLAAGILNGAVCVVSAALVVVRIGRGAFWLLRTESSSAGTLVIVLIYSLAAEALIWIMYDAGRPAKPLGREAAAFALCATLHIPLFVCYWADLSTLAMGAVKASIARSSHRRHLATVYSAVMIGVPAVVCALIVAFSAVTAAAYVQPAIDNVMTIRNTLIALAPTWTGRVNLVQLLPLIPVAEQTTALISAAKVWLRATYAVWASVVCVTFFAWLPLSIRQVMALREQTTLMKPDARGSHDKARRDTVLVTLPTLAIEEKAEAINDESASASKFLWSRPSYYRSRSSGKSTATRASSNADVAEARVRYLLRLLVFRQVILGCATLALSVYVALSLVVATDPLAAATRRSLTAFTLTTGFWTAFLVAVPVCVASALQQPLADDGTPVYGQSGSRAPLPTPPLAIFVHVDTVVSTSVGLGLTASV